MDFQGSSNSFSVCQSWISYGLSIVSSEPSLIRTSYILYLAFFGSSSAEPSAGSSTSSGFCYSTKSSGGKNSKGKEKENGQSAVFSFRLFLFFLIHTNSYVMDFIDKYYCFECAEHHIPDGDGQSHRHRDEYRCQSAINDEEIAA